MLPLQALGNRIMVLGPSNAGKSTLALALSEKLDLPAVHLDQLQHLPNTDWRARPEAEFKALHEDAIMANKWVMDGNYSRLMPRRFERATGAILITSNHWLRLARYLKRSLINPAARAGSLDGGQEYVKWEMGNDRLDPFQNARQQRPIFKDDQKCAVSDYRMPNHQGAQCAL